MKPKLVRKMGRAMKKASPTILTCIGAIGVVATAVLAVKATPKALELVEADSRKNHDGDPNAATKMEAVKSCWKCYIPAAATGVATITCVFGANILNRRQQASLASAYALLNRTYQDYRRSVKNVFGEEGDQMVLQDMAIERVDQEHTIYTSGAFESTTLDFGVPEEEHLFYDIYSDRQFTSTIGKVLQAEYHLNRMFAINGEAMLNEFYKYLGIAPLPDCEELGWWVDYANEIYWVEFNHTIAFFDDGPERPQVECLVIEFPHPPCPCPPDE